MFPPAATRHPAADRCSSSELGPATGECSF